MTPLYQFRILQTGELPLRPDGHVELRVEHRCTSVLVFPAGERASPDTCLATDPCFTDRGAVPAREAFEAAGVPMDRLRRAFVTHGHHDHLPRFPRGRGPGNVTLYPEGPPLPGLALVPLPGHSADMRALVFPSAEGEVWVVGDAVLDREWLEAWGFYWPNLYGPDEIVQHWRSVARLLRADAIVPGHGAPIRVTGELLDRLLADWDRAEYGERCPDVRAALEARRRAFAS
jgi:glyoxylase-like metal-dependent hydrolase (beta-lactamase superfamily II)